MSKVKAEGSKVEAGVVVTSACMAMCNVTKEASIARGP